MKFAAFLFVAGLLGADDPARELERPFLAAFFDGAGARPVTEQVRLEGLRGFAAHPARQNAKEHFPAVLVLSGSGGVARDFAEAGFAALAVDLETAAASPLADAIRAESAADRLEGGIEWLRRQPYVDAARLGAIGWGANADTARELARRGSVRAVVVSGDNCRDSRIGGAAMLVIGEACGAPFPSEKTWVAIYEFFGKHLEDAPPAETHIARVADIMRVINSDDGVKGRLSRTLASPPDEAQWERARSEAAILAESGNLLAALPSPKGDSAGWREQAAQFRDAAAAIVRAIDARDWSAARDALRVLPRSCASCHRVYR